MDGQRNEFILVVLATLTGSSRFILVVLATLTGSSRLILVVLATLTGSSRLRLQSCLGSNSKLKNKIMIHVQGYDQDYDVVRLSSDLCT
jgi:hypothetical protein